MFGDALTLGKEFEHPSPMPLPREATKVSTRMKAVDARWGMRPHFSGNENVQRGAT